MGFRRPVYPYDDEVDAVVGLKLGQDVGVHAVAHQRIGQLILPGDGFELRGGRIEKVQPRKAAVLFGKKGLVHAWEAFGSGAGPFGYGQTKVQAFALRCGPPVE